MSQLKKGAKPAQPISKNPEPAKAQNNPKPAEKLSSEKNQIPKEAAKTDKSQNDVSKKPAQSDVKTSKEKNKNKNLTTLGKLEKHI